MRFLRLLTILLLLPAATGRAQEVIPLRSGTIRDQPTFGPVSVRRGSRKWVS